LNCNSGGVIASRLLAKEKNANTFSRGKGSSNEVASRCSIMTSGKLPRRRRYLAIALDYDDRDFDEIDWNHGDPDNSD
jgi:hypothetical protein